MAVPEIAYADTTGERDRPAWYAVGAIAGADARPPPLSTAVLGTPLAAGHAAVEVRVAAGEVLGPLQRPWRPIIGSEHLSLLLRGIGTGGRPVGAELAEAFSIARRELGVRAVRAHGILLDELSVYREVDGRPVHDFSGVDAVYDRLLSLDLRPIVELSFMPRDLARDPSQTVFAYGAGVSPPKSWERWEALVHDLVRHLVHRYGLEEVRDHWAFEVWNEANLAVFWSGTQTEFLHLYEVTARAVKRVHPALRVGGPASAAAAWIGELLDHAATSGAAVDFLSTHTYGNAPLDVRAEATSRGRGHVPVWWTEWGITPRHFNPISDTVFGAPFVARGMKAASGRSESLAYWVVSDHFEELGTPEALFHGGFGLLTVGNLRKPQFWALHLLERLGDEVVACTLGGDGADSLVQAWASRDRDGRVAVAIWNGTLDQARGLGDPLLERSVTLVVDGLGDAPYRLRHLRVDDAHSNIVATWGRLGGGAWPDTAGWDRLHAADTLDEFEPARVVVPGGGRVELRFPLPMPGLSFVELVPQA
jgi:xylan 1,4-beta-xylosidase